MRIATSDPQAAPLIDPNYWADPYDRECSVKGLRLALEILRQPALKPFVIAERLPGDGLNTDDKLAEYAYRSCKTDHHPAATCAMGSGLDAVVAPDLKLRGLLGIPHYDAHALRVDAHGADLQFAVAVLSAAHRLDGVDDQSSTWAPVRRAGRKYCKPELHTLGAFGTLQVSLDSIGLAEKNFDGHCHI